MNSTYSRKWSLFTFVLSAFVLFFYIKEGLFSINEWLYHTNGDSLKNYFNVLQAAKHSDGFWLNNLNYPFGEQLFFLDSQPLFAKLIGMLNLESYTIGMVNSLPLLSISLTTIPIFLIQRELKIALVTNIITAIIISFLAPQIARGSMHFALAYGFYIPMLIYLIMARINAEYSRYLLIILLILTFSFLHPYYLLIGAVLLTSFLLYHLFFQFNMGNLVLNLLGIIVPLIIVKVVLQYTDPVLDRPEMPFGIWHYRSTFNSVFLPKFKPAIEIISEIISLPKGTFEGNAYVGILGFPIFLVTIVRILFSLISKQSIKQIFRTEKFFYLFFASFIIWIFALYTPLNFIIDPLIERLPILKQFRSLGRFGWIFYFVFSIFISINLESIYYLLKTKTNVLIAGIVFLMLTSLWFLDANGNLNTVKDSIEQRQVGSFSVSNYLNEEEVSQIKENNKFNVILTLPIFSVGSEIENYEGSGYSIYESYIFSNLMNIPYVSTFSSRVSAAQFYKVKAIKDNGDLSKVLFNNEVVLIIADINNLNKSEKDILEQSEIIYKKDFMVYAKYKVNN